MLSAHILLPCTLLQGCCRRVRPARRRGRRRAAPVCAWRSSSGRASQVRDRAGRRQSLGSRLLHPACPGQLVLSMPRRCPVDLSDQGVSTLQGQSWRRWPPTSRTTRTSSANTFRACWNEGCLSIAVACVFASQMAASAVVLCCRAGLYKLPWDMTTFGHRQTNPLFVLRKVHSCKSVQKLLQTACNWQVMTRPQGSGSLQAQW